MINEKQARKYCREDISKIPNYRLAIADKERTWVIHHERETIENISAEQLVKENRYVNRPACELIFMTKSAHRRLHNIGTHHSEETRKRMSKAQSGENNHMWRGYVQQLDLKTGEVLAEYPTAIEAERQTNIRHISAVCRGEARQAGGYKWQYKKECL